MTKKSPFTGRALLALLGACLFQCAFIGILINSNGVFMTAIRESVGLPMTMISANTSIRSVAGATTAAFFTAVFYKTDCWKVMLGSVLVIVAGFLLLPIATDNFLWYLIPVLSCHASSIGILAIPHLMQQWFPEHSGTASGIAMAFSGLGGAVFNPVAAALCTAFGWQFAVIILCGITLAMAGAGLLLLFGLKGSPEEAHPVKTAVLPEEAGIPLPVPARFLMVTVLVLSGAVTVLVSYINLHMEGQGYSLTVGATVTSFAMFGNIGGKLIFGWLSDRLGTWKTMALASALVAVGSGMLGLVHGSIGAMYLAATLFGACYYCATIALSRCTLSAYGAQLSRKYTGLHVSINGFLSAALAFGAGPAFDLWGSFTPIFVGAAVACTISSVIAVVMAFLSMRQSSLISKPEWAEQPCHSGLNR